MKGHIIIEFLNDFIKLEMELPTDNEEDFKDRFIENCFLLDLQAPEEDQIIIEKQGSNNHAIYPIEQKQGI